MKTIIRSFSVLAALCVVTMQLCACRGEIGVATPAKNTEEEKTQDSSQGFISTADSILRSGNFAVGKIDGTLLKTATPGAVALISCCMYYESKLQEGIQNGQKWVYTNSSTYSPQSTSFDNMLKSGKYGANCAMPANWAYIDMGIINEGQRFWGVSDGSFKNYDKLITKLSKAVTVTSWSGTKKFKEIFAEGKVKAGDVFLCKGHTFIYLGDELFLAAGHDGKWHSDASAPTEDSRHAVFDTWVCDMKSCSDYNYTIFWQMSFKEDYIPACYRDALGKIVQYTDK